jgi:hypothetical protein
MSGPGYSVGLRRIGSGSNRVAAPFAVAVPQATAIADETSGPKQAIHELMGEARPPAVRQNQGAIGIQGEAFRWINIPQRRIRVRR